VAGFLAAGGSLTSQWKTLALPILHTTTFSMQIAVVDQVQFEGADTPRSVVLDAAAIDRAAVLGRNVASQLGVAFDQARYLGPPGLCPMCHLDVVALRGANVECATCGVRGRLGPDLKVTWTDRDLSTSVISMDEKRLMPLRSRKRPSVTAGSTRRSRSARPSRRMTRPCGRSTPGPPDGRHRSSGRYPVDRKALGDGQFDY
jgi:hypothetical protein